LFATTILDSVVDSALVVETRIAAIVQSILPIVDSVIALVESVGALIESVIACVEPRVLAVTSCVESRVLSIVTGVEPGSCVAVGLAAEVRIATGGRTGSVIGVAEFAARVVIERTSGTVASVVT
jgi:hypothetical protein